MVKSYKATLISVMFLCALALLLPSPSRANQQATNSNKIMGRVDFIATEKADKSAGVWVDGQYVGHVSELKGDKKVLLLPGDHDIVVREAGYKDQKQKVTVQPAGVQTLQVHLEEDPNAVYPSKTNAAEVKLRVEPDRAAVFVDGKFVGYAHEFGGVGRAMLVAPGKHQIKVALVGYKDFTSDLDLHTGEKYTLKTNLQPTSAENADPSVKHQ